MSLEHSNVQSRGATVLSEESAGVYAALFNKINLSPVSELANNCAATLRRFSTMLRCLLFFVGVVGSSTAC